MGLWMRILILRWIALVAMSVWLGGFMFYSAVVIPILHEILGTFEAGMITREVTNYLNAIGAGAILTWWALAWVERSLGAVRSRGARFGLLAISTAILLGLILLHLELDARIDAGRIRNFYGIHRVYLVASTVQWGTNLLLLAVTLGVWRHAAAGITHDQ
jgi:hypothetical protein